MTGGAKESTALAELRRWTQAGGTVRIARDFGEEIEVSLCRCDGGEEARRLLLRDPAAIGEARTLADPAD